MMDLLRDLAILAVLLFLTQECLRRSGKTTVAAVFLVLPLIMTPFWFQGDASAVMRQHESPVLFAWIKLYSMCSCACFVAAACFTRLGQRPWLSLATPLILSANILEAVLQDLLAKDLIHSLNAASGALLIVTVPYQNGGVRISGNGRCRDLHFDCMTRGWVVGYTLWN